MRILMTGATGFLGHEIARRLLIAGHDLVITSRNARSARERFPYPAEIIEWDLGAEAPPKKAFAGIEGVIHLAGESVVAKRWSTEQKKRIHDTRVLGTRHLWDALSPDSVKVFVAAAAIGFYGDGGDATLTEASPPGRGFLAEVCQAWEREIFRAGFERTRKVAFRIGVVLGKNGGAMEKMLPVFRAGLGGRVGSGRQWMGWVHLDDVASAFVRAIDDTRLEGVLNLTAPEPVTNADFTRALGKALRKPAILPAPAPALKIAMGEMASIAFDSTRVVPEKLLKHGFEFRYPRIEPVLAQICTPDGRPGEDEFFAEQWIPRPVEEVFSFFSVTRNLEEITPSWLNFKVEEASTESIGAGTLIDYRLRIRGMPVGWKTRIEDWEPNTRFVDTQLKGPYAKWHHTHTFIPLKGGTLMQDRVIYRLPFGSLGRSVASRFVRRDVEKIFDFRRKKIQEIFSK